MRQKQRGPIIDFVSRFLLSNPANPILLVLESRKHALDKKWLRVNKQLLKYTTLYSYRRVRRGVLMPAKP